MFAILSPRFALAWIFLSLLSSLSVRADTVTYILINGDTISGEHVESESTDEIRVLISPVLGRLEIDVASIKSPDPPSPWTRTISGGFSGNDTDGKGTFSGDLSASSRYQDDAQRLSLAAGINYSRVNDKDKDPEIKTKKANALISYESFLSPGIGLYATTAYNYDYLKNSGVNSSLTSLGVGFPVVKTETTDLTLKVGPSINWTGGGKECSSDKYCGNAYGGGSFFVDFGWKPTSWFKFGALNRLTANFASEVKPANTFTATLKFIPSATSNLFTSLKFESIYQSMSTPKTNNTVSGQVGVEF